MKTALVFGSTGLIGNLLVEELIKSGKYLKVKTFVRQSTGVAESSVEEIVTDFSDKGVLSSKIVGDDMYVCLGTTIRKAGSVANMEKIDRDLPVSLAAIAVSNGVKRIAVVSSIGAGSGSSNYYLRIKGEMEESILRLGFETISIVRPSMLLGERKERRAGEMVGKIAMKVFQPVMAGKFRKYRAIHGRDVAKAMIALLSLEGSMKRIYESDELQKLADGY
jgi:uncharacterized protein YbjT (DUF2867 family)